MSATLSATEIAAFTGLEPRRVRKELEHGVFGSAHPPRFERPDLVYFSLIAQVGLELGELGVEDRKRIYRLVCRALEATQPPARLPLGPVVELNIGDLIARLDERVTRFEAWKRKLVEDDAILGGEPVFPKSRLAVRQVGGMLLLGASWSELREDYPYLDDEDLDFAKLYAQAYPRAGRPREASPR